jgi:hypothetical protein
MPLARVIGAGCTQINPKPPLTAIGYMVEALHAALQDASLSPQDLDGLVAVPSLVSSSHFMQAHVVATTAGLLPRPGFIARTVDTGGGPELRGASAPPTPTPPPLCRRLCLHGSSLGPPQRAPTPTHARARRRRRRPRDGAAGGAAHGAA